MCGANSPKLYPKHPLLENQGTPLPIPLPKPLKTVMEDGGGGGSLTVNPPKHAGLWGARRPGRLAAVDGGHHLPLRGSNLTYFGSDRDAWHSSATPFLARAYRDEGVRESEVLVLWESLGQTAVTYEEARDQDLQDPNAGTQGPFRLRVSVLPAGFQTTVGRGPAIENTALFT